MIKYIKLKKVVKRDYDLVTFTAKRRGNHPDTDELGMYRIACMFNKLLQEFLLGLDGVVVEIFSMNIDKNNINNKDFVLRLSHKKVEMVDMSPCDMFWMAYEGLENQVIDSLGVKIWR